MMQRYYTLKSTEQRTYNCLNKDTCPLQQKCFTANIVYTAKVTSNNRNYQEKVYFGSCKNTVKNDFPITNNHLIYMNIKMKQSYQMKSGE